MIDFELTSYWKMMFLGAQKGYPPWARSPPQIKRRTPQLVNPTQPRRVFFHRAFLMCKCFVFSATATSTLHCLMFLHPPPRGVFGPSVKFQDAKTEKKDHLPNDRFLIKIFLKNDVFGSSERLPPLSAVPPTNKKTHPPISKPPLAPLINAGTTMAEGAKIQLQCSHILIDLSSDAHLLLTRRDPVIIAPMIERTCIWIIWCHEICHPWVDDAYW